jgi:hypothetical protein
MSSCRRRVLSSWRVAIAVAAASRRRCRQVMASLDRLVEESLTVSIASTHWKITVDGVKAVTILRLSGRMPD